MKTPLATRWARARRGFSLVELLVVIGIVLVLSALIFPAMSRLREKGSETTCVSHMRKLASIIMQYSAENNMRLLPAASGQNAGMNDKIWYMDLADAGFIAGNPAVMNNQGLEIWGGNRNSFMACPSRKEPPYPYWMGGKHALHYTVNQHPGFFNRVNTLSGAWPTLAWIKNPSRTFLLAEVSSSIGYSTGDNLAYPHPRPMGDLKDGESMNLVFYDGHAEKYKGKLPVLPGANYSVVPYAQVEPEKSFPWY